MQYFTTAIFVGFVLISSCTDVTDHVDDNSIDLNNNPSVFDKTDYKIVFTSGRGNVIKKQVYVMNKNGSNQTKITDDDGDYNFPQVSPNGRQIIFHSHTRDDNDEIYSVNYDGTKIIFRSHRYANYDIFEMNLNGGGQRDLLNDEGHAYMPCFSPDGEKLLYSTDRLGYYHIWIMDNNGMNQTQLTEGNYNDYCAQFFHLR